MYIAYNENEIRQAMINILNLRIMIDKRDTEIVM